MMMTQKEMLNIVQSQLAIDLNCSIDDLNGEKDSIVFVEAKENPGCRPFPRNEHHFDIVSMGKSIVVSATPERLAIAKKHMQGKDRDTIFALPFIRGLWLHYLPDLNTINLISPPENFSFEVLEHDKIVDLLNIKGFNEAIIYDTNHPYQTELAVVAKKGNKVVGVAGGCKPCSKLYQIGIDVLPEYRNFGLATYIVNCLTFEILNRGYVPNYSTKSSNIVSQRVAHRAGYYAAWVSDWRCNFEGLET
jgi:GNAT superfamily N-acetyltransferase